MQPQRMRLLTDIRHKTRGFPGGSDGKESACNAGDPGSIPGQEGPMKKDMETHSSILAWRIPWKEEIGGGLQSIGSQRVGYNSATNTHTHIHTQNRSWGAEKNAPTSSSFHLAISC